MSSDKKSVKTAEPIRPKFCVGPHMTPGNAYECSKCLKISLQLHMSEKLYYIDFNFKCLVMYLYSCTRTPAPAQRRTSRS